MLTANQLKYEYPGGKGLAFPDLNCGEGESMLIMGDSGSGKTTLLHLLAGVLQPVSGSIWLKDTLYSSLTASQRDNIRGKEIGMVFQKHLFIHGLTVIENLLAAQKLAGLQPDSSYLSDLMQGLEIYHLKGEKPHRLSDGEQQRFSIARALANRPAYILADEPTSSLDDNNCRRFMDLIRQPLTPKPVSWIVATHDQRLTKHFSTIYHLKNPEN